MVSLYLVKEVLLVEEADSHRAALTRRWQRRRAITPRPEEAPSAPPMIQVPLVQPAAVKQWEKPRPLTKAQLWLVKLRTPEPCPATSRGVKAALHWALMDNLRRVLNLVEGYRDDRLRALQEPQPVRQRGWGRRGPR